MAQGHQLAHRRGSLVAAPSNWGMWVTLSVIGWIISLAGMVLWFYGYLATGNPPIFDWQANTPWWISDFLPNVEFEIGMALLFVGMVPIYWPRQR